MMRLVAAGLAAVSSRPPAFRIACGRRREDRRDLRPDRCVRCGGSKAAAIGNRSQSISSRKKVASRATISSPIDAGCPSKTDVAINEAERLLNDAKVDLLMGFFSAPLRADGARPRRRGQEIMWANVCVASAVFKDKNLQYVFPSAGAFGPVRRGVVLVVNDNAKASSTRTPKTSRCHHLRDGPYGAASPWQRVKCKELGLQVVHKEGYRRHSPDLSALVTKLRRARPTSSCTLATIPTSRCSCVNPEAGLKWAL